MRLYFNIESDSLFWADEFPSEGAPEDVTHLWEYRKKAIEIGLTEPPEYRHQHVYATPESCGCQSQGEPDRVGSCAICDWGLAVCDACGCGENQLAMDCPRYKVSSTLAGKISAGEIDFFSGVWL